MGGCGGGRWQRRASLAEAVAVVMQSDPQVPSPQPSPPPSSSADGADATTAEKRPPADDSRLAADSQAEDAPPARAKPWAPLDWAPGPRARWRQGPWPQTRAWESPHQPPNHPSFGALFGPGTTWGPAGYFHVSQMATDLCFCYEWRHTLYAVHTSCKTERESANVVCNRLQLACPGAATGLERPRGLQSLYRGLQESISRSNKDAEQRRQSR